MDSSLALITINNYGTSNQVNFDVMYDLNGTIVTETVADTLYGGSSDLHFYRLRRFHL